MVTRVFYVCACMLLAAGAEQCQEPDSVNMLALSSSGIVRGHGKNYCSANPFPCALNGVPKAYTGCRDTGGCSDPLSSPRDCPHYCDQCCSSPSVDCTSASGAASPDGLLNYDSLAALVADSLPQQYLGYVASGCTGQTYFHGGTYPGYDGTSAYEDNALFFLDRGAAGCSVSNFFLRPPAGQTRSGCVKYGDDIVLALTANAGKTENCGYYGCRVAKMVDYTKAGCLHAEQSQTFGIMKFDHGSDSPMSFYLQPPPGSGLQGQCIKQGDPVVLAQTANVGHTDNCGWYGCRVATIDTVSGWPYMVFTHGGETPYRFIFTSTA
eukprot:TRINITY_DN30641_c0_g1_i1.p1 TRINITY_DN30641_c0_g1~~TRINITY_DN30641_c0_g1_i1.p1  ORF type:complete len:323 (-),score=31.03 TRINITY_DN30641_c0_g1_i1:129-1097(-)